MTQKRTPIGLEVEETLGEVLAHVRGEIDLPCRIAGDRGAIRGIPAKFQRDVRTLLAHCLA